MQSFTQASHTEKIVAVLAVLFGALPPTVVVMQDLPIDVDYFFSTFGAFGLIQILLLSIMLIFQPRPAHITGAVVAVNIYYCLALTLTQGTEASEVELDLMHDMLITLGYFISWFVVIVGAWLSVGMCDLMRITNAWACGAVTTLVASMGSVGLVLLIFLDKQ